MLRALTLSVFIRRSRSGSVGNQQNWDTSRPERSGVWNRFGKLPEGPVVKSTPIDGLGLVTSSDTSANRVML
jgi:hypothetical protein